MAQKEPYINQRVSNHSNPSFKRWLDKIPQFVSTFEKVISGLISLSIQKNMTFVLLHAAHQISVPTHHLPIRILLDPQARLPKQQHFELSVQLRNPLRCLDE